MNNLEISAYIDAKKKSKIYIENQILASQEVLDEMKAQKPVKWYNNFYYILKKNLFIFLAFISFFFLLSSLIDKEIYENYFNNHYDSIIVGYLNENFGTKSEIIISETSAVDQKVNGKISFREIREDLKEKLTN